MRKLLAVASVITLCSFAVLLASLGSSAGARSSVKPKPAAPTFTARAIHPGAVLRAPARYRGHRIRRYRWERCNRAGRGCRSVRGATHRTYRVKRTDVGHTFRVQLTVSTGNGTLTVTTGQTPVIAPPAPVNLTLPTIGGTAQQGDTLTSDPGTWTNAVSFTYQWEDCDVNGANCTPILNATGTTYLLGASDVGHTIRLVVTAYNTSQGSTAAISRAID